MKARNRGDLVRDPIRIGGEERLPAYSLDQMETAGHIFPESESCERWDWDITLMQLANGANFTRIERNVFFARFRQGVPLYLLPAEVGVTPKQLSEVLKQVIEKVRVSWRRVEPQQGSSTALAFRERLSSGHRVWGVAQLDKSFLEIMRAELFPLCSHRDPAHKQETRVFCPRVLGGKDLATITDLQKRLKTEIAKRDRIAERVHQARVAIEEAEAEGVRIEESMRSDQVAAELEERAWSDSEAQRKLKQVRVGLGAQQATLSAARIALDQQSSLVEKIEAEIAARRHEMLAAAIVKTKAEAFRLVGELANAAVQLRSIAAEHAYQAIPFEMLFDDYVATDPLAGCQERQLKSFLLNTAADLYDQAARFSRAV